MTIKQGTTFSADAGTEHYGIDRFLPGLKKISCVTIIAASLAGCGDDPAPPPSSGTVGKCVSGLCLDATGDAGFAEIDLQSLRVTVNDPAVFSVEIELLDIPGSLTYNSVNLPDNALEYEWGVAFDVDGDGRSSNDIRLTISHYKPPGSMETQGAVLDFTQKTIWQVDSTGLGIDAIGAVTVTQNLSTLTMTVDKVSNPILTFINSSTPFKFRSYHRVAGAVYTDFFPEYGYYTH